MELTNRIDSMCNTLNAQQSLSNHIYSRTKDQREYDLSIILRNAQILIWDMSDELDKHKEVR